MATRKKSTATAPKQAFDKLDIPRLTLPRGPFTDLKFCARAAKLFADGGTRAEVAAAMEANEATVSLAALVHEYGLIPFRNQDEFLDKLVKARDTDEQGWAVVGARLGGLTEGRTQALYQEHTGIPYTESDLGRGGRPKGSSSDNGKAAPAKAKAKKGTRKATAKKTAPRRGRKPNFGDEPTLAKVSKTLNGKVAIVKKGTGTVEYEVTEVQAVKQAKSGRWGAKVTTADGAERTFPLDAVEKVAAAA